MAYDRRAEFGHEPLFHVESKLAAYLLAINFFYFSLWRKFHVTSEVHIFLCSHNFTVITPHLDAKVLTDSLWHMEQ